MSEVHVVPGGRMVTIGRAAAENIARSLELPETAVDTIEQAMADEISAMSAHFAFTIEDMRVQWEKAEETVKNHRSVIVVLGVTLVVAIAAIFVS